MFISDWVFFSQHIDAMIARLLTVCLYDGGTRGWVLLTRRWLLHHKHTFIPAPFVKCYVLCTSLRWCSLNVLRLWYEMRCVDVDFIVWAWRKCWFVCLCSFHNRDVTVLHVRSIVGIVRIVYKSMFLGLIAYWSHIIISSYHWHTVTLMKYNRMPNDNLWTY